MGAVLQYTRHSAESSQGSSVHVSLIDSVLHVHCRQIPAALRVRVCVEALVPGAARHTSCRRTWRGVVVHCACSFIDIVLSDVTLLIDTLYSTALPRAARAGHQSPFDSHIRTSPQRENGLHFN